MQPKLKGDTFFLPVEDGIYFRNNQGSLKMKGQAISRWVESLAPYLNGEHTLDDLTVGLDLQKQAMVRDLVNTLTAQGFVKDISQDLAHNLSPTEQETYASEIAFIDSYCHSAASRFERFREQQVLVIGSGLTLTGLVHACLKSGVRQVAVLITPECETNTRRHQEYLELFHEGDPRQTLREINAPRWEDEASVLSALEPFQAILHVSDRPMLARARLLNRLCASQKKNLLQAILIEDRAWIGPMLREDVQGCWECAMLRLRGNLTKLPEQLIAYAFADQGTAPLSRFLAPPTAALVANRLSFELFKSLTGAGPVESIGHLIEMKLETLQTQKHAFMPHPLCQTCQHPERQTQAEFLGRIQHLEQGEALDADLFSKRLAPCFETRLGLFRSLGEGDLPQLPVSVTQVIVSNPVPGMYPHNLPAFVGSGATFAAARMQGAKRACEVYAASVVDRRRLFSEEMARDGRNLLLVPDTKMIQAERFFGEVPPSEAREWTWAVELSTGQACLVPAALVFPFLRRTSPLGKAGLGVGSGMSWVEAVGRGLLDVARSLTMTHIAGAQQPYPQVNLPGMALAPHSTRERHILRSLGDFVTIYDVTGPLQIPTFAICSARKALVYTTHVDAQEALRDGLEQVPLYRQLADEPLLLESLPSVPDLPVSLRGDTKQIPVYEAPGAWPERQIWLQRAFEKQGWRAFAVPLDHDPALQQIQPYIVRVLVARTENL